MKNWRTTLLGIIGAVAMAIEPLVSAGVLDYQRLVWAGFFAALGFLSKDAGVSGKEF